MAANSLPPKPKGTGSTLPLLFILLTVGILAAGGYFVYTTMKGSGNSSPLDMVKQVTQGGNILAPRVTENDFKDIEDPLIRKHLVAQINVGKYRIISTSDGMGKGSQQTMEFAMQGNDVHYRMMQKMDGKDAVDMISIGDTTYVKDFKDSTWWKQKAKPVDTSKPVPTDEEEKFKPIDLKEEYTKSSVTYKKLGEEACGSLTCHKYQEVDGTNKEATRTFWFDTRELLLRKEQNGFGEFLSEQTYSYDNLNVSAPSPTKDVPEGKSVYDYMIQGYTGSSLPEGMPSLDEVNKMMPDNKTIQKMMEGGSDYTPPTDEPQPDDSSDTGY